MTIVKDLLLNLFFIVILTCFLPIYLEHLGKPIKRWGTIFLYSLAIILCISFPIQLNKDFVFDLRGVPIIVGGLYGGPVAIFVYSIVTIFYRLIFGGLGFISTLILMPIHALVILIVLRRFNRLSFKRKLLFASLVSVFLAIITLQLPTIIFNLSLSLELKIGFISIMTFSTFFIVYLTESIREFTFLRQRIIKTEKLEVVSHLAASISHEVRNPLTASRGMIQLLKETPDFSTEKREQFFSIAIEELDRAESVISDYLTFAKPTIEKKEEFNAMNVVEKTIEVIRPLSNMNSVSIIHNLERCVLIGEASKLQQCLVNLMKNSVEAMQSGGTLTVECNETTTISYITVSDTGIGMSIEQLERLGMPFYTTKGMKGTGLGLMLVYRIIEEMNGTIKVKSELGKGTQFTIEFKKTN